MARNTIRIAASRQAVFDVLSDGWTYTNWVAGTSHMRAVDAAWPEPGSRLAHASGLWPLTIRDETVVEACEPGRHLTLTARGRPFGSAHIEFDLADDGEGCTVTMTESPSEGPGKWLHNPLAEAVLVRRNTETLARLAALVERRTEPQD